MDTRKPSTSGSAIAATLALALVIAAPSGVGGAGGGEVVNDPPVVIVQNLGSPRDAGSTDIFSGTILDPNGEHDLWWIHIIQLDRTSGLDMTRELTPADLQVSPEPADFGMDSWKVWNPTAGDGQISFKAIFTHESSSGTVYFDSTASDVDATYGHGERVIVELFEPLHAEADPVDFQGNPLPGTRWGGWSARAGIGFVPSQNALKVVNGKDADAQAILDFTGTAFVGTRNEIPLDGNIRFRYWEDTTPEASSPAEGGTLLHDYADLPLSDTGSLVIHFSGPGHIAYVTYVIDQIPLPAADEAYEATFTVSQV